MSVALLTEDETRGLIRRYLDSFDWWVFPIVTARGSEFMIEIETTHYTGKANADFEMFMLGIPGCFTLALAHKRRMSIDQLSELLQSPVPCGQDVICLVAPGDDVGKAHVMAFHDWVMGDDGWKPKKYPADICPN